MQLTLLVGFIVILLFASSLGLLPHAVLPQTPEAAKPYIPPQSDKALHFICFFALTATFYFILDTSRRRVLHLTLFICTLLLAVGSEIAQGLLPNDRDFDPWDVLANVLGSLLAVTIANQYHKRAAERRRKAKYLALGQEDLDEEDLELGEGPGLSSNTDELGRSPQPPQETGTVAIPPAKTVEEELDNWDENIPDEPWEEDDDDAHGKDTKMTPATSSAGSEETPPKRIEKIAVD